MSLTVDEHLATGEAPGPGHDILTGRYACYDTYQAGDGRWLAVGAIEPAFYANLCKALGCERWIPHQRDDAVQEEIREDFRAAFRKRDRDEWVAELTAANTCVAPVQSVAELVEDAHFAARGVFVEARHPERGSFRQLGAVLAGMNPLEEPVTIRDSGVTDTDELLGAAGLSAEEIEKMRSEGIVA
jgi:crotonobetainyl-CoA:carnitine CoA-transferase CaiB-like acyl-CoA transferase